MNPRAKPVSVAPSQERIVEKSAVIGIDLRLIPRLLRASSVGLRSGAPGQKQKNGAQGDGMETIHDPKRYGAFDPACPHLTGNNLSAIIAIA